MGIDMVAERRGKIHNITFSNNGARKRQHCSMKEDECAIYGAGFNGDIG